ncbi:Uncharacterized protein TPAR_06454 [Tolypocladium paradoxum]|uniref:Stress-associated endoplasmic reticulum protein n=1 Tax=Tolypocladium paradoxum TaxID=94208 RepID=A0A2S4KT44_9HYPO|nr:Uncharacterized protein TPAR_06454 [Tolypocladium paradoxum]
MSFDDEQSVLSSVPRHPIPQIPLLCSSAPPLRLEYSLFYSYLQRARPNNTDTMAQTLEQRRRNAKFAKDQEARMGKSDDQIKKRVKETLKPPISMFWVAILGFIIFGGLIFEALSRMFGQ